MLDEIQSLSRVRTDKTYFFFSTILGCRPVMRRKSNWSDTICSLRRPTLSFLLLLEEASNRSLALVKERSFNCCHLLPVSFKRLLGTLALKNQNESV